MCCGFGPGEKVVRRFTEGSANLQEGTKRFENFGVGLNIGEENCDAFSERMGLSGGDLLDNGKGIDIGR